jgi:hypothetical protein
MTEARASDAADTLGWAIYVFRHRSSQRATSAA